MNHTDQDSGFITTPKGYSIEDYAATLYEKLGIDRTQPIHTPAGRPIYLAKEGHAIPELFYRMRLAFTTAFASPGEIPTEVKYMDKAQRNFEFIQQLFRKGSALGEISKVFAPEDLAMNFYGMMNVHVMGYLFNPATRLDRFPLGQRSRQVAVALRGGRHGGEL